MIILLGFPKSGTTSFTFLFNKIGYKSYHWTYRNDTDYIGNWIKKSKLKNEKLLSFLPQEKKPIALTQMDICLDEQNCYWPQLVDYKLLYEQYPNALFILNMRDPDDILKSMKKWQNYDKRILKYNPELFKGISGNDDEKILKLIKKHFKEVIDFFHNNKKAKFIKYHIIYDKIEKLQKYINTKNIQFPQVNKN
jgi:hypothetical protein